MMTKEIFQLPLILLKVLGFSSNYEVLVYGKLWQYYARFWILLIFINTSFQTHYFYSSLNSVDKLIGNVATFTQSIFLIVKLLTFYFQRAKFDSLMDRLVQVTNEEKLLETESFKNSIKFCHKVVKFFIIFGTSTGFLLVFKSTLGLFQSKREFPYPASFFFDLKKSPIFEFAYLNACLGPVRNVCGTIGMDGLFFHMGLVLAMNFENLRDQIETSALDNKKLKKIIKYHENLFEIFKIFNQIHFPILVAQFLLVVSQFGVLGFQITMAKEEIKRITSVSFLVVSSASLFQYSYIGNEILKKNEAISDAIYNVIFQAKLEMRKDMRFMMMRAQKPLIVRAGFYKVTFNMFSKLVNSALSYMALLKSLADE